MLFKFLGSKKLIVLMLAFIFFIALMGFTSARMYKLSWPEKFLKDTVSFTQSMFYKPAGSIAGFFGEIRNLRVIYEENKSLKITVAQYARDRVKLNYLEEENERLKSKVNFTERQKNANKYTFRYAEATAQSPDPYNHTITVNLGEKDGIVPNMAVMSELGLVGRIVSTSAFYSNVQLISDLDAKESAAKAIAATTMSNGKLTKSFGMIESYDTKTGMLQMTKIPPNDPLKKGDTVITSGLGGVYPRGIIIGTVMKVEVGEFGITHVAEIKPAADLKQLQDVFIVEVPKP
ncbi:rod shape-determining protein MreC [Paenibacillus gansuensis]|uniref:Cell shape-determining protein MreC n=1 Tax=Paenibacillus gansuensis TaxID=306542 RepID=A0ABW5PCG6_9BACL